MQRRRRRDRHLRCRLGVPCNEAKMVDHRVAGKSAELAFQAQQNRPRLRPLEFELALAVVGFDALKPEQKISLPGGAAIFSVGDGSESDLFLLTDQLDDFLVLDRPQRGGADFAAFAFGARLLEGSRAQQAADVIGAEGRGGAEHGAELSRMRSLMESCAASASFETVAARPPQDEAAT